APVWLFWSPQGQHAPFVCAEPWYGLCDPIGYEGDVSGRPYINSLTAGGVWEGEYTIEVLID
ncbi:MAG: aldose 1-epimerase family protein, partial [Alloprevotella sp.]|nr:aldose 1-epimerase family protein [Alloprevotella sp.]